MVTVHVGIEFLSTLVFWDFDCGLRTLSVRNFVLQYLKDSDFILGGEINLMVTVHIGIGSLPTLVFWD